MTFHLLSSKVISIKGLVAQWTRAHGYEPWCQGFESLLARFKRKKIELITGYSTKLITLCYSNRKLKYPSSVSETLTINLVVEDFC